MRRFAVFIVILALCTVLFLPVSAQTEDFDGYLVKLSDEAPRLLSQQGAGDFLVVDTLEEALEIPDTFVEYIEPNYAIYLLEDAVIGDTTGESTSGEGTTGGTTTGDTVTDPEEVWPNDPLYSTGQPGLQGIYGLAGMEQGLTGAGVVVGMVDSGVHAAHEDLNAENMSGSNYVSDELPYSVDSYGHGTVVAGVIAAQTNNGVGVAGIAPDAQLRVYRCFNSGKAYTNEVVPAILQAAADGCQVINLSLGTEYNVRSLREAVEEVVASGAVVVAAVGNTGGTAYQYPAAYPGVIGVGSVDAQLQVSSFSQRNDSVVAVAPGEEMTGLGYEEGTPYRTDLRGTSYAAPAVSAMAALALEYDSDITPDGIRYLLETTSADSGDIGYDTDYGWGVVDLEAYLAELKREFSITYELNGGELPASRTNAIPERFHVTDDDISLPEPTRKFFLFTGWYADEELTQPVEYIPAGSLGDVTLYAGWEANLSLSILGDSISTYTDWSSGAAAETTNSTIASGAVYYTVGRHNVAQTDTWWQQTADALDLRLLVNNSWSGSCVFNTRSDTAGAWVDRCVQLHDDTGENAGEEPAIIAVFLGTNDFSYYTSQLGRAADIDYDALITQTEGGFTYTNPSTVCEAYAIMLHKMTVRYPDTEIYCMTMLPRRADASVGQPEAFSADISAIAEHFGCYVADLYEDCGIPAGNETFDHYFPDQRVHPNCFGMDAITGTLVSAILENSALLPENRVLHPVSYNLTDVLVDQGTAKTLLDGTSFSVSLTAPEDYGLEVTVSMGGRDITEDCYSDGVITIDCVTGAVSVTAEAVRSAYTPVTYRWMFDGTDLAPVTSGGQTENVLTRLAGTATDGVLSGIRYRMEYPVCLRYDEPWVVEWKAAGNWSGMLLSAETSSSAVGNTYLFKTISDSTFMGFGQYRSGSYWNYGNLLGLDTDFTQPHIYRLENRITPDGNMVYLLLDGAEIGPMNLCYLGGSDSQGRTEAWLNERDLKFSYIGTDGHALSNCTLEYLQIWEGGLPDYSDKVISVFGDSISTFAGYIPVADGFNLEHLARYPQDDLLTDVNETWWMQVIGDLNAKLGINDSWRGATVTGAVPVTTGTTGENAAFCNLTRIANLGSNGTPDVILFYGGTNDLAHVSEVGTFDPAAAPEAVDLTTASWDNLADAYVHTLLRLRHFYPDTAIVAMLPAYTASYYSNEKLAQANAVLADICAHYNIPCIDLRDCGVTAAHLPDGIHPGEEGMDLISEAVVKLLLSGEIEEGTHTVYSVSHTLQNVKASLGHYQGIDANVPFAETLTTDDAMEVTIIMGGKDITADCYSDGAITIDRVTGDLSVTARALFSLGEHLQNLPDPVYRETNLWTALTPESGYFMGAEWSANYSSITFPVSEGDQIYANAFGAAGENGGTRNGIRVTFFDPYGVNKTMTPDETYAEYLSNGGYVVAPAGTVAVNVVLWKNDTNSEVRVLNLPHGIHDYQSVITPPSCTTAGYTTHTCTICGDWYNDSEVPMLEHSFTVYHPDSVTGAEVALCDRGCGMLDTKTGETELKWQLDTAGEIEGVEYGIGRMLMALYDEYHQMLAVDFCTSDAFTVVGNTVIFRFAPPAFSMEDLAKTAYVVRFSLELGDGCAPTLQECRFE